MYIPSWIQASVLSALDIYQAIKPQSIPARERLETCKIVSHRGEHDNRTVFENTLAAFDQALEAGVWGIEFDIRWTKDLVPVVCHDPDCRRVFGKDVVVAEMNAKDLFTLIPEIPSLEAVLERYRGKMHFMIEIKDDPFPAFDQQQAILKACLAELEPVHDYHFLALDPALYSIVSFAPKSAYLPVAELNVGEISQVAIEQGYAGVSGHFLFLNDKLKRKHEQVGQAIGTGFIASKNGLFQELNRGVAWIFSNDAVKIQAIRDRYLR